MRNDVKARVIAYYLPQYHPIPENDKYWGKGFTEWTNVVNSKPLFRGHYQPQLPADLGFYDLRVPEVREQQADLAKKAGIEGFCYWHYWFGNGKKVLERPFEEVVEQKRPDFPFCLGWANHDWTTKTWEKGKAFSTDTMIFKQEYLGDEDYIAHFKYLLPAFKDKRYITVDGKLLFVVFQPFLIPDVHHFIELWNELARENGLKGFYFVGRVESFEKIDSKNIHEIEKNIGERYKKCLDMGFDGVNSVTLKYAELKSTGYLKRAIRSIARKYFGGLLLDKHKYSDIIANFNTKEDYEEGIYPQLIPKRDRSPRSGRKAVIYYGSTPELFGKAIENAYGCVKERESQHKLIFLNAWNEWGEGSYMEPDKKDGHAYLDMLWNSIKKE